HHEYTTQFEGAERIADSRNITRGDCDDFGKLSQDRAALAWNNGHFDSQVVSVDVTDRDENGQLLSTTHQVTRDEGVRETTIEGLADLRPTGRPDGVHTAGTSSQIADGASALLMMTKAKAQSLGLRPLATALLKASRLTMNDIDVVEINEAFAAVVLAWQREFDADMDRVNPNGGAIAIGHPLGATGTMLLAKAAHELVRTDGQSALVTMCCGGGLGTGTLIRRA
ncbi:MAG: steroid 3-ketoacyl-CoA thiolase, partial [Actinomycetota bacterium]